jgi:hypothetical protein
MRVCHSATSANESPSIFGNRLFVNEKNQSFGKNYIRSGSRGSRLVVVFIASCRPRSTSCMNV